MAEIDNWWRNVLNEHEQDGATDADKGVFDPPYAGSEDPEDEAENLAYKTGFDRRRRELGKSFKWKIG